MTNQDEIILFALQELIESLEVKLFQEEMKKHNENIKKADYILIDLKINRLQNLITDTKIIYDKLTYEYLHD